MNVLWQCPICGSRLFAPGGRPIYKCNLHTDTMMEQMEEFAGPNFEFLEEDEVNPAKTGLVTPGVSPQHVNRPAPEKKPEPISEEETLRQLRDQYERVSGELVDKRWGIPRLRREIEKLEYDLGEATKHEEEEALLERAE